ncbi:MAG: glycosyltransferase family 4 protein, partial [Ignavibacteria bacterium]|nr:glycosyltransferase family 4 protein [Ignavibacteria bacterium]
YKRVIGNSNIVITRGERVIKEINNFFHRVINCVYVPNLYLFDNKKVENIENKKKIILYCGSFSKSKRVDILIEGLYYLKKNLQLTNYTVKLFGDGELKQEIIKKSFEYGLANLEFNSYINEIEKEIINSDVAIKTSENEGQPMFLVESLAYGIPVIMPNISNIPDLAIHNYNALLVEPLDVEGFADAIYRLMTDEVLYKKLKAGAQNFRKEHEYEFSMENITNIWNDIFKQLGLIEETNAK